MNGLLMLIAIPFLLAGVAHAESTPSFDFDGKMSREVLEAYLSRAVTHAGLGAGAADPASLNIDDDLRMLTSIGAKFIGRAAFAWSLPKDEDAHFEQARLRAERAHRADPQMLLQACVFEIVTEDVNHVRVPAWVFEEFGLPVEDRCFSYSDMLYRNGLHVNRWSNRPPCGSVPDMSRLETRMWFFYRAARYIKCGYEAIHFGQVHLMDARDPGHKQWRDMLTRVRQFARQHARRHFVLCDAHTHGVVEDGRLLFDFHSFPSRPMEIKGEPTRARLDEHFADAIYGKSKGGVTPSGWSCEHLPYLAEVDNWGFTGKRGQSVGGIWIWGWDEMSWFAHQSEEYRNAWLIYA